MGGWVFIIFTIEDVKRTLCCADNKATKLLRLCPDDEDTLYQIVNLLVDTCATNRKTLRIAGDDKPAEVVRSRFIKLNADHIRFVLKCLAENSNPIRNIVK